MQRYWKIWWRVAKMSLMRDMIYKIDFFVSVIGIFIEVIFTVLMFYFIFAVAQDGEIAGIDFSHFLLVKTVASITFSIGLILFINNAWELQERIYLGKFDMDLLKPINALYIGMVRYVHAIGEIPAMICYIPLLVWLWFSGSLNFTVMQICWLFILLFNSVFIMGVLFVIGAILEFFVSRNAVFLQILHNMLDVNAYPRQIYPKYLRWMLTLVVPMLMIANPIYRLYEGSFSWEFVAQMFLIDIIFVLIAYFVWFFGLKSYQSAA